MPTMRWSPVEYLNFGGRSDLHFCLSYLHPGDNPSYRSFAARLPGYAASIVILANDETASIQDLLRQLL